MRKGLRLIKRMVALFLVLLLSIESFGAVVSDNDGSAFITKAEFDSLKNNFQSQIDQYNSSIDSKIDGAIAGYLAGVMVKKTTTKSLIVKNWDTGVTSMNGKIDNTFKVPNVSGSLGLFEEYLFPYTGMAGLNVGTNLNSAYGTVGTNTSQANGKICWMQGVFNYFATSQTTHKRVLVDNVGIGSSLNVENMTWAGIANNVLETWTLSKLVRFAKGISGVTSQDHDPGYLEDKYVISFIISTMLNINAPGYVASFVNKDAALWNPSVRWRVMNGSTQVTAVNWGAGYCLSVSAIPSVNYNTDSEGKTYSYQHIINYKNDTSWEVTVKDVTNYLSYSSNNTLRTNNWVSAVTGTSGSVSGSWTGTELERFQAVRNTARGTSHVCGWINEGGVTFSDNTSAGATNKAQIPVIGRIGNYTANQIYQFKKGDLVDDDGEKLEKLKLFQGIPIMKVKQDEIIEWEPKFKNIKVDGATGINECKIILSYVPFTNKTSISNTNDYVKMDGITKGNFAVTTDKKVKIKFEADRDSFVYAKWVPNTSDSIIDSSTYWETTLDIENCNTYNSTKD